MSYRDLAKKALDGSPLDRDEGLFLAQAQGAALFELIALAGRLRQERRGSRADLCAIVSGRTGACSEDCAYCAQSSRAHASVNAHPLIDVDTVIRKAREAHKSGARRFSVVISGRGVSKGDLPLICRMVEGIRGLGLSPCASLGIVGIEELKALKEAGLHRYHHNIETSRAFFPSICTTHTYDDRLRTIHAVAEAGLSLCSGGIFGMGESWQDRVDMALELRALGADSVPINFLVPIQGTPLAGREQLSPFEALKAVSLYRFLMPDKEIRVAGGRLQILGEFNSLVFMAGADSLITGDMLTTGGRSPDADIELARAYGLDV